MASEGTQYPRLQAAELVTRPGRVGGAKILPHTLANGTSSHVDIVRIYIVGVIQTFIPIIFFLLGTTQTLVGRVGKLSHSTVSANSRNAIEDFDLVQHNTVFQNMY